MKNILRMGVVITSGLLAGMTANYFGVSELNKALLCSLSVMLTFNLLNRWLEH
jgi:hypothetical protein